MTLICCLGSKLEFHEHNLLVTNLLTFNFALKPISFVLNHNLVLFKLCCSKCYTFTHVGPV